MTLTEISYYSRRLAPLAIIGCLVLLIFYYTVRVYLLYRETQKPKKSTINTEFGKIKKPSIQSVVSINRPAIILDTVEGQPITATDTAKVFSIPPATARFGYREKIYLMAKTFGFNVENTKHTLEGTEAVFTEPNQTLKIDITNFNFTYEYDVKKEGNLFENTNVPQATLAEEKAKDLLRTVGRYPEELAKGKTNTIYLLYDPETNRLATVSKPQEANVVEVDFYRPDIMALPQNIAVVSPKYFNGQNYVIMVFNEQGFKLIKAQVRFFEKSDELIGIYPLKTGDEALKELQEGNGIIVSRPIASSDTVTIKKMFLGYADPDIYQEYLQPVYVFLGEQEYVAYIPAIRNEYSE